jgi:hypothetical protein
MTCPPRTSTATRIRSANSSTARATNEGSSAAGCPGSPRRAQLEHGFDLRQGAHATADLHRDHDGGADVTHDLAVLALVERGVEIDHVQPARALLLETGRDSHRVVGVGGLVIGVAAQQPDGASAAQVDRRDHDHAATSRTMLA